MNNNTNKDAITEAIELLVDKGVDLSNALSEGGLLKQLTTINYVFSIYRKKNKNA